MAMTIDAALKAGARLVTRNGKHFAVFHDKQCLENGVKSFSRVHEEIPQFPGEFFESPILTRTSGTIKRLEGDKVDLSKNKLTTIRTDKGVSDLLTSGLKGIRIGKGKPETLYTESKNTFGYTPTSHVDYLTLDHTPMFLEKEGEALGGQSKIQTFLKQFIGI